MVAGSETVRWTVSRRRTATFQLAHYSRHRLPGRHRQSGAARSTAGLPSAATPRPATSRESTPTDRRGSATAPASCVAVVLVPPRPPLHHLAPGGPRGACTMKSRLDRGLRTLWDGLLVISLRHAEAVVHALKER